MNCTTCKYFNILDSTCRYNPPKVIAIPVQPKGLMLTPNEMALQTMMVFPIVGKNVYCWKWESPIQGTT